MLTTAPNGNSAYLSTVHGRNSIDGFGGPGAITPIGGGAPLISQFVHYGDSYNRASWLGLPSGGGVMIYGNGDGSEFSPL